MPPKTAPQSRIAGQIEDARQKEEAGIAEAAGTAAASDLRQARYASECPPTSEKAGDLPTGSCVYLLEVRETARASNARRSR